jgi:uncharacterized membrane protein (UPF0127 family)
VSARARLVAGVLVVGFGVALLALAAYAIARSNDGAASVAAPLRRALAANEPAVAPFDGLTEVRLSVGGRCLRLVVADTDEERGRGLMDRTDLGPYDGMLFVSPVPSTSGFTMANTRVPLDIAWYDRDGVEGHRTTMVPCRGTIGECPVYDSKIEWRFALETLRGDGPSGDLAPCA